jgi:hypothetical protein
MAGFITQAGRNVLSLAVEAARVSRIFRAVFPNLWETAGVSLGIGSQPVRLIGGQGDERNTATEHTVGRETMQLRHIRPGSVDWYDALNKGKDEEAQLSPDQVKKLHSIFAPERLPAKKAPVKEPAPKKN